MDAEQNHFFGYRLTIRKTRPFCQKGVLMYLKQLMASEIRRNTKKRRLQFKVLMRYLAVSVAFAAPLVFAFTEIESVYDPVPSFASSTF